MSSTSIMMARGTWVQLGDSVNHSSDLRLKCCRRYPNNNGWSPNTYAVLQFAIPTSLKYKRITRAVIRYYCWYRTNGYDADFVVYENNGMEAAPYITGGQDIYNLTGANIDTLGTLGDWITVEPTTVIAQYPRWRTADVTSIMNGNISNDSYFTVFLAGGPGYTVDRDRQGTHVASIGTGYEAYLDITYEDVTQLAPTPTFPVSANVNENQEILFTWAWNSSTEAVQTSVQLEYKLKSASNYTVVSLTQTGHTYKLTSGLAQGTYQWRIKGTNDAAETSAYSNVVEFNVVGKPAIPVINAIPNRTLTEISWNAVGQLSCDITLTDSNGKIIDEKTIANQQASYKPNIFLKGTYTFGVRIRNATGLSSDWAYRTFSITATGPAQPTIRLMQDDALVKIDIERDPSLNYALIRCEDVKDAEEKVLGFFDGNEYIDKTFALYTTYKYYVRVYSTGGYTDSEPVRAVCKKTAIVLETNDDEIILDRSESTFLPYTENPQHEYSIFKAYGRKYPIVEIGEGETWTFRSSLYVKENQKERLKTMAMKNKIYYRDYSGRAFQVAIEELGFTRYKNEGYIADIQFTRISEEEVIVNV